MIKFIMTRGNETHPPLLPLLIVHSFKFGSRVIRTLCDVWFELNNKNILGLNKYKQFFYLHPIRHELVGLANEPAYFWLY